MAVTDPGKLAAQLRILLQLTQSEAQVAEIRVAQARTDAVRRELAQNATNAERRTLAIARELRRLGGVPDVVSPVLGRVVSFVKSGAEQAQPFPEALFGDLLLEHQLLDRSRYTKVLAKELGDKSVLALAERLETAHTATVEWLTTVLAEEALGGPAALRPTPFQVVTAGAYRVAVLPGRWALSRVNAAAAALARGTGEAREVLTDLRGKAAQVSGSAIEAVGSASRDGENRARAKSGASAAEKVHEARRSAGVLEADELPIANYEDLPASAAAEAVKKLSKAEDIRAVVRFEENHKDRSTVVSAAQTTLARIAQDAVNN